MPTPKQDYLQMRKSQIIGYGIKKSLVKPLNKKEMPLFLYAEER